MKSSIFKIGLSTLALMLMSFSTFTLTGCEQKEKVLDVETPSGELEIERDKSDGSVGVELNKKEQDENQFVTGEVCISPDILKTRNWRIV